MRRQRTHHFQDALGCTKKCVIIHVPKPINFLFNSNGTITIGAFHSNVIRRVAESLGRAETPTGNGVSERVGGYDTCEI